MSPKMIITTEQKRQVHIMNKFPIVTQTHLKNNGRHHKHDTDLYEHSCHATSGRTSAQTIQFTLNDSYVVVADGKRGMEELFGLFNGARNPVTNITCAMFVPVEDYYHYATQTTQLRKTSQINPQI